MKFLKKLFIFLICILAIAFLYLAISGYVCYSNTIKEQSISSRIQEIQKKESYVSYDKMATNYLNAVVAVEDHRFYEHGAIDFISIGRAIVTNITHFQLLEGGSTITQQVAKNVCFSQEKSILRKFAELFAAFDLEKNYSKQEILEIYVNTAYFGEGYYGIGEASNGYYEKSPKHLNLDEASLLAGVPNAPSIYAPTVNPELSKERQIQVLERMVKYGYIQESEKNKIDKR